ncbi:MAG: hypothetical protein ACYT04_66190 [Nostoc sp.]
MTKKLTWIIWGLGAFCVSAPVTASALESILGTNGIDAHESQSIYGIQQGNQANTPHKRGAS